MALLGVGRGSVSSLMKLKSSEGLAGTGGYTSKMVHLHGWPACAGCWHKTSVLPMDHSIGLLECPPDMVAGFHHSK